MKLTDKAKEMLFNGELNNKSEPLKFVIDVRRIEGNRVLLALRYEHNGIPAVQLGEAWLNVDDTYNVESMDKFIHFAIGN